MKQGLSAPWVLLLAVLWTAAAAPGRAESPDFTDPAQLALLVGGDRQDYVLVDVRTASEFEAGHIPTAINIPWDRIASEPPTEDTTTLVIVYCASGNRSSKAAAALRKLGYTRVVDFGALSRWTGEVEETARGE